MFLGLGKEAISIMFAIFSVAVTLFASSPQFVFDNGDDENQLRKLKLVEGFDIHDTSLYEIEKFILYNSDLALDKRILKYNADLDYRESLNFYYHAISTGSYSDKHMLRLHLAIIPVFYNSGNPEAARGIFEDKVKPFFLNEYQNTSISELVQNEKDGFLNLDDILLMKYRYADYATQMYAEDKTDKSPEFPGCDNVIFRKNIFPSNIHSSDEIKCTHQELRFIDKHIKDLNYDSYFFNIGNKYQKNSYSFYQDDLKTFFVSYMNWLIIGVVLVSLVAWTSISKTGNIAR